MAWWVSFFLFAGAATAASTNAPPAAAANFGGGNSAVTEQDYRRMLDRLQITTVRRGRDGSDPQSPFYANYDEAKANPFPNLPDPLVLKNGRPVTTPEMWWQQRRPEIVEDFDREIYGRAPPETPKVNWEVLSTIRTNNGQVPVITKRLAGHVDNSRFTNVTVDIQVTLTTPAEATGPVPVMLQFGFNFGAFGRFRNTNAAVSRPTWQQQVLARGWGYAVLTPTSVQADNGAGLTRGIIGLMNRGQPRQPDDWGALRAWAWGASRTLDYFETDPAVDARQVGLEGHSRYGKAALMKTGRGAQSAINSWASTGRSFQFSGPAYLMKFPAIQWYSPLPATFSSVSPQLRR